MNAVRGWQLAPSDGVEAAVEPDARNSSDAVRLRVNFKAGSGFVALRRPMPMSLPENYIVRFTISGEIPTNSLEIKLLDRTGDNVWWVNQRAREFSSTPITETLRRRHFSFAWGPDPRTPLSEISAIEFALVSSSGGEGEITISDVSIEPRPVPQPPQVPRLVGARGTIDESAIAALISGPAQIAWRAPAGDADLTIDLTATREFGGVIATFDPAARPRTLIVSSGTAEGGWAELGRSDVPASGRVYLPLRDAEASSLRVTARGAGDGGMHLQTLEIAPLAFGATTNSTLSRVSADQARGLFPRYLAPEQTYWTVVGVADDPREALLNADGMIEVDKERFSLEPAILLDSGPLTWANATISTSLARGDLPIPSVRRTHEGLRLDIEPFVAGAAGQSTLIAVYSLTNTSPTPQRGHFVLGLRPFQVNPPWQDLKTSGGAARVSRVSMQGDTAVVAGPGFPTRSLRLLGACEGVIASAFVDADAFASLVASPAKARSVLTSQAEAACDRNLASGAFVGGFELAPGRSTRWVVVSPLHPETDMPAWKSLDEAAPQIDALRAEVIAEWGRRVGRVGLTLPRAAQDLERAFRTVQGHILINRDGAAIQPGSRTYERSWIRDGSLTSSALLQTGHTEAVRQFIEWYAPYQYENGKIPCVVDRRGPDPVPEHDSHGQFIYLLHKYYLFTGDRATLERHFDRVVRAVDYIQTLRAPRQTDEYRLGDGLMRAKFNLVTESISHEGYSAKPMHSYWDGFFVLKGFGDAARIATILGREEQAQRFGALEREYRAAMLESIDLATRFHNIDYIPGCVELGDFDATSTTVALWPCGETFALPRQLLLNTFDRFVTFFRGRVDGSRAYLEYTPYEWRLVQAMLRLHPLDPAREGGEGWRRRAMEFARFYMNDRRPHEWNQWGEIVWKDPANPRFIGDMPHTWVGSDFLNAARAMFVLERDDGYGLAIGLGIDGSWFAGPDAGAVRIDGFPTERGTISYTAGIEADGAFALRFELDRDAPPAGIDVYPPVGWKAAGASVDGHAASIAPDGSVRVSARSAVVRFAPR